MVYSSLLARVLHRLGDSRKMVLLAWELGGGLGHIQRLLPIAVDLVAAGHRVVFALRRREHAGIIRQSLPGTKILQAPCYRPGPPQQVNTVAFHYADLLYRCGYEASPTLHGLMQQWRDLLASVQPALVICDHSPTVLFAAAAGRVPTIHIGSGFATPPVGQTFLALHSAAEKGAKAREARVLQTIQQVGSTVGIPNINAVPELLGLAEMNLACCLKELDPYRRVRSGPAVGPVQALPPPQPSSEGDPVFGYLNGDDPNVGHLLESLFAANLRCALYIRNCRSDWMQRARGTTVTLYSTPRKMPDALIAASAVVHHGGLSTSEAALALGRPQFLFPRTLEQSLTAGAIEKMNSGVDLSRHRAPGDFILRALKRGAYQQAAAKAAEIIAARRMPSARVVVAQACARYLGAPRLEVPADRMPRGGGWGD